MEYRIIDVRLPLPLLETLQQLSLERDCSLGDLVRSALTAEVKRTAKPAKTPNRADEQLLAPLRVLLASDLAEARSWSELSARLNNKGYELREAGGGLALHSFPEGVRLCKASELGYSYGTLMRRFGTPFPGHRHAYLARRLLETENPVAFLPPDLDDSVIEPF